MASYRFGSSAGSSGSGYSFARPKKGSTSGSGYTTLQLLSLLEQERQKPKRSILGSILHGGGMALGKVLNVLSRPNWAVAEGTRRGLEGEGFELGDFFKGLSRGVQAKKHTTFSDVIRQEAPKFARSHKWVTGGAGFALDVLTDPTLPLLIGSTIATGGATSPLLAARLAVYGAAKTSARTGADHPAVMKGAIQSARKALDSADDATSRRHKEWLRLEEAKQDRFMSGDEWSRLDEAALNLADIDAKVELSEVGTKVMQARYSIPFTRGKGIPLTPTSVAGMRTAPKSPSLLRTAHKEGVVGKIPLAAGTAMALGRTFKHGFDEEGFAKPSLAAKHAAEMLVDDANREAKKRFGAFNHLSDQEREKALQFGEETPDIILSKGTARVINEDRLASGIAAGEVTTDQANFMRTWHDYWENQRKLDTAAGIPYEKELGNKLYVPHIYNREGGVISNSTLGEVGYAKERLGQNSIAALKQLRQAGDDTLKKYDIETDIMKLAATRTRRGAMKQATQLLKDHMRRTHGTIIRVPDVAKRAALDDRIIGWEKKIDEQWTHNPPEVWKRRGAAYRAAQNERAQAFKQIETKATLDIDDLNLRLANKLNEVVQGRPPTVPTYAQAKRVSDDTFKKAIAPLPQKHRIAAQAIRGGSREVEKLRRELKQLEGKHGKNYRPLADRAVELGRRIGHTAQAAKLVDESTNRVLGVEQIGYAAQPQGKAAKRVKSKEEKAAKPGDLLDPKRRKTRGESWRSNIVMHLDDLERYMQNIAGNLKRQYPTPRATPTPQYDRLRAGVEKRAEVALRKALEKENKGRNAFEENLAAKFETGEKRIQRLQKLVERGKERRDNIYMRNPDIPKEHVVLDSKLSGEKYAFAPEIHRAMSRVEQALDDEAVFGGLAKNVRKLTSMWKIGVTSVNPGYRVRNTMSDVWNMYIAGVPMGRVVQYGQRAAVLQARLARLHSKIADHHARGLDLKLKPKERQDLNLFVEAYNHGILSGLFQGDIQTIAAMYRSGTMTKAFMTKRQPGRAAIRAAQTFNRNGENWGRLTHYLYRRDYQRLSASDSADWVKKAHFDYEELTPVEQQKFKLFIPFYTWSRKNIPYQLMQLAARPGKYATFPKAMATFNELATGDTETPLSQEDTLPKWMRDRFAFRVPGMEDLMALPQIGVTDLSKLQQSPAKTLAEMAHPALRVAFELGSGRSLLTGEELRGGKHPRRPISGPAAAILQHIPGANVGQTSRNVRDERVEGVGASPWVGYIAGQLPWLNQLVNRTASIKQEQQGSGVLPWLAHGGGISAYQRDLETEMDVAQIEFGEKMERIIAGLRDEGRLELADDPEDSAYTKRLRRMMGGAGG